MKLHNEFRVPLPPREAWQLLNDVERVAPCFPGAKLEEVRGDRELVGTVSLRLGPVALSFRGTAVYQEVDAEAMRVKVRATGTEQRARGTAMAFTEFSVIADEGGSRVLIDTDMQLAGSIAQYARGAGMIEATAQVMIDDFAGNLQAELNRNPQPLAGTERAATEPVEALPEAPAGSPPSLLRLLWLAFRRWISGPRSAGR